MHRVVEDEPYQQASLSYPEALDLPTLRGSGSDIPTAKFEVRGETEAYYGECVLCEGQ